MARTRWPPICEPRPLAQARQIGPAALVGAETTGTRPTGRCQDNLAASSRIAGQTGSQPDPTSVATQNHGSNAEALIHILPADSEWLMAGLSRGSVSRRSSAYVCRAVGCGVVAYAGVLEPVRAARLVRLACAGFAVPGYGGGVEGSAVGMAA